MRQYYCYEPQEHVRDITSAKAARTSSSSTSSNTQRRDRVPNHLPPLSVYNPARKMGRIGQHLAESVKEFNDFAGDAVGTESWWADCFLETVT